MKRKVRCTAGFARLNLHVLFDISINITMDHVNFLSYDNDDIEMSSFFYIVNFCFKTLNRSLQQCFLFNKVIWVIISINAFLKGCLTICCIIFKPLLSLRKKLFQPETRTPDRTLNT